MKLAVKSDYQGLSSGPRITRASLNVEEGAEESEGDVTGGKWPERHNSAGFESGKGAMSQEMWAALEAGKKKRNRFTPRASRKEHNASADTLTFIQ